MIGRRACLLGAAAGLVTAPARSAVDPLWRPRSLELREVAVEGSIGRRFVLGVPRGLDDPAERLPLLVLLHGLAETTDERTGAWAWFERYGLGTAYDRLVDAGPFRGLVLACPYLPNLPDAGAIDAYARFLTERVLPAARARAPVYADPRATYLGGCSLGGRLSLEVLLRRPAAFGAWGGVQAAIGVSQSATYARRLHDLEREAGRGTPPIALLVETSQGDPFRTANEALAHALTRSGVQNEFVELPGLHDQEWLRTAGTPTMLQWFDALRPPAPGRPDPLAPPGPPP